jgi:UDP-N-acetylmuramoylalanine--D-glutamate ligase
LGGGESGIGAAVLALKQGFDVFLSDKSPIKEKYKAELVARNIAFEEGQHDEARILDADEVIKSPGIPEKAPLIQALRQKGIPIISEIEFAGRYTNAKKICITGSNGKTTTTLLTYHIFKNAGLNVGLAGNVGKSFALQVAENDFDYYILELSSFQLDGMYEFKADVAILPISHPIIWIDTSMNFRITSIPNFVSHKIKQQKTHSFFAVTILWL